MFLVACGEKEEKKLMDQDFSQDMISKQHIAEVKERLDAGGYSYLSVSEKVMSIG